MSDLEGLVRSLIRKGLDKEEIIKHLSREISLYKDLNRDLLFLMSETIYEEVVKSLSICLNRSNDLLCPYLSNVKAGEMGIGSRGYGDFYFHDKLREIAMSSFANSYHSDLLLDDAGWFKINDLWIITAIDGIHSRLAYFPLIAGFHAARAAARDVLVKGGLPFGFIIDLRIADDGDPSYLLEVEAGVASVAKFLKSPILSGSTLRIGGDMVIGERIVGTVGCIGYSKRKPFSRVKIGVGDILIMTEGSGGGTISTAAIFEGNRDIVKKTLNFNTIGLLYNMIKHNDIDLIKSMFDVTNGGLRGDLHELSQSTNVGFVIDIDLVKALIDSSVLRFMEDKNIDPLGVSLDSIIFIVEKAKANDLVEVLRSYRVKAEIIGKVISRKGVFQHLKGSSELEYIDLKYREAPYTRIKKVIGSEKPRNLDELVSRIEEATRKISKKRDNLLAVALKNTKILIE